MKIRRFEPLARLCPSYISTLRIPANGLRGRMVLGAFVLSVAN
jgi:hypothetical protein